MEFKELMKERRRALGLTLEDVAQAVGVGRATAQRWESGNIKNMRRDKVRLLADVLQIPPIDIINADELDSVAPKVSTGSQELTEFELDFLRVYRLADETARTYAFEILASHPKDSKSPSASELARAAANRAEKAKGSTGT